MTPTQELVLDCYRSPHLLRSLADTAIPLPEGMDKVLRAAVDPQPDAGSDIPPELRDATLLYVKHVMLLDEADHYRILGVRFDAPAEQIDAHYRWLVALLQLDKSMSTRELSRRVGRISRAHAVLSDPRRRHAYDKARYGVLAGENFDLPVEMLVESILKDQSREIRQVAAPMPMAGELQPWRPPQKAAANEGAALGTHSGSRTTGETLVFRGPSNGALLAMSGAALLVILAISPVIVSRYSAYFMPPEPNGAALTTGIAAALDTGAIPQAPTPARNAETAALPFLTPNPNAPAAPSAIFAGGDGAPFLGGEADEMLAAGDALPDEPTATPLDTAALAESPVPENRSDSAALEPVTPRERDPVATPDPALAASAPTSMARAEPTAASLRQASQQAPVAEDSALRAPLVMANVAADVQRSVPITSAAPPPAAAATVPVSLIDSYDLDRLVERLAATYREGDTDGFVSLFAETARTNDQPDRLGIAADYAALFDATERRSLQLADVQWKRMEDGAVGEGRFVVRLKPKWKKREEVVSGTLTLEVKRQDKDLTITGLFHDYGTDTRP